MRGRFFSVVSLATYLVLLAPTPGLAQFPSDYGDSRNRFRSACPMQAEDHIQCETFPVDPQEDLSVDSLWVNPEGSKKVLVLVSGVHGVETFAGAAIQMDFIEHHLEAFRNQGISVFLVHSLNPWGYQNLRRVTASNIDLNRNFPSKNGVPPPRNQGFAKLNETLKPESISGPSRWNFFSFAGQLLWKIATFKFSVDEMNQAVAGGQWEFPRGLFFGGQAPEPQVQWLKRQLDEKLQGYDEALLIDLHTGLGERGVLHLMPSDEPAEKGQTLREKLFGSTSNETYQITTEKTKGFYSVAGDFLDFAEERGSEGIRIAAMTMEFGTKGTSIPAQLASLHLMAAENAAVQIPWQGEKLSAARSAKAQFVELFSPSDEQWKKDVLEKSRALFTQVLKNWKTP